MHEADAIEVSGTWCSTDLQFGIRMSMDLTFMVGPPVRACQLSGTLYSASLKA